MRFRKMLPWGNLALLVVFGFVVARAVMMPRDLAEELGPQSSAGELAASSNAELKIETPQTSQPVDLKRLREDNLFTPAPTTPTAPVEQVELEPPPAQPAWQPQIVLQGTITGPEQIARAIVQDKKTSKTQLLRLNEKFGPAKLIEITRQSIVLDHHGRKITLYIQGSQPPAVATFDAKDPVPDTEITEDSIWALYDAPQAAAIELSQLLLSQADIAQSEQGVVMGLRLKHIDNEFRALGLPLQNGDVALAINGQKLTGKQKAFQVLQKAQTQTQLTMEVLRDGKHLELSVNDQ